MFWIQFLVKVTYNFFLLHTKEEKIFVIGPCSLKSWFEHNYIFLSNICWISIMLQYAFPPPPPLYQKENFFTYGCWFLPGLHNWFEWRGCDYHWWTFWESIWTRYSFNCLQIIAREFEASGAYHCCFISISFSLE